MKIFYIGLIIVSFVAACQAEKRATLVCVKKAFTGTMAYGQISNSHISHSSFYEYEYKIYNTTLNEMRNGPDTIEERIGRACIYFFPNGLFAENCSFFEDKFKSASWGSYKIDSDTITASASSTGSVVVPFNTIELKLKVIDSNTLQVISCLQMCERSAFGWKVLGVAKLKPIDQVPTYEDCWMLEKKWFWKREADWKRYMDSVKPKK
jgi:hypothetical protein